MDGVTIASSQCNNRYIFPGLALGAALGQTGVITNAMINKSAEVRKQPDVRCYLGKTSSKKDMEFSIFPDPPPCLAKILEIFRKMLIIFGLEKWSGIEMEFDIYIYVFYLRPWWSCCLRIT